MSVTVAVYVAAPTPTTGRILRSAHLRPDCASTGMVHRLERRVGEIRERFPEVFEVVLSDARVHPLCRTCQLNSPHTPTAGQAGASAPAQPAGSR